MKKVKFRNAEYLFHGHKALLKPTGLIRVGVLINHFAILSEVCNPPDVKGQLIGKKPRCWER